jgi:hydroxymethylglutaryl-CoA lyase
MPIKITECPRDAMQGLDKWIPTNDKADYINQLLKVGFDVIDFASFVSPKAIPQLKDTARVLDLLDLEDKSSKLLAIIANSRGARDAALFNQIDFLGFPFSISETFQLKNTNSTIEESLSRVEEINSIAQKSNKKLLVYISMAFGNPYGDAWSPEVAGQWIERLNREFGITDFALADTVGVSDAQSISAMFKSVLPALPDLHIGAHLHSTIEDTKLKVESAYQAGCRSFDVAINGLGGCPMTENVLVGNVATENLLIAIPESETNHISRKEFGHALIMAQQLFS